MAGRDMTLQVVIKLRDMMSAGLGSALNKIKTWGSAVGKIIGGIGRGILDLSSKFGALGIGVNVGLGAGLQSFTQFDAGLRDIAITAGLTGDAVQKFVDSSGAKLQGLARETGQVSSQLLEAHKILTAANVELGATQIMLPAIGRGATAAGASVEDIAKTTVAVFQNAQLPPDQLGTALAHMIVGGKLGSFELKDMSQYYPEMLAAMANQGIKGMEAINSTTAMLQISKRTAGTPGTAADNMKDFLSNLNSAHTIKRFKDQGVDISAVLADATARGINPVEAAISKVAKIIDQPKVVAEAMKRAQAKGLDPSKTRAEVTKAVEASVKAAGLGELFVNQQAKMFLNAMLANTKDYLAMKGEIAGAGTSVVDQDFASRMAGPEAKQRMATENVEQLMRRLGSSLQGLVGWVDSATTAVRGWVEALDGISPKIVDFGVKIGAAISTITGLVWTAKMAGVWGGAAPAAAATAGAVAAPVAAGATAGATSGWFAKLLGAGRAAATGAEGATWLTRLGWAARVAGRAAGPLAVGVTAYDILDYMKTNEAGPWDKRTNPNILKYGSTDRFGRPVAPPKMPGPQSSAQPEVKVGGTVIVKVEGPGQVTGVTSTNPAVPITTDRGANGGRP